MRRRRSPEIIAGRVNGDGSIAAVTHEGVNVVAAGGNYTVTLPLGFRLVAATANPAGGGPNYASVQFPAATGVDRAFGVTLVPQATSAATAMAFTFIAVGVQQ